MQYGNKPPTNRAELIREDDVLPLLDAVGSSQNSIYGSLPPGLTVDEIDTLELTMRAAEERRNPSKDAVTKGRKAALETMFVLALESIDSGDVITAGSIRLHFLASDMIISRYHASQIDKYMRLRRQET